MINCGRSITTSTYTVLNKLDKINNNKMQIIIKNKKKREIESISSDNTKLKKILNYKFKYDLDNIIKSSVTWIKRNY